MWINISPSRPPKSLPLLYYSMDSHPSTKFSANVIKPDKGERKEWGRREDGRLGIAVAVSGEFLWQVIGPDRSSSGLTQEPGAASVRLVWENLGRSLHNCLEAGTMVSLLHR